MPPTDVVAVLIDLVNSRRIENRESVQRDIERGFAEIDRTIRPREPLHPTVGDEFQGVYTSLPAALAATLLARLSLPAGREV
jgi:hypothetical protein